MKHTKIWLALVIAVMMTTLLMPTVLAQSNPAAGVDIPRQRIQWAGDEDQKWFWAHFTIFEDGGSLGVAVVQDDGTEFTYRIEPGQVTCVNGAVVFNLEGTLSGDHTDILRGVTATVEADKTNREDPIVGFRFTLDIGGSLKQFDTTGGLELYGNSCQLPG